MDDQSECTNAVCLIIQPKFTPAEMLSMGVFEGKYLNDCVLELPREWFEGALAKKKLCPDRADYGINEFQIKSRSSLQQWNVR